MDIEPDDDESHDDFICRCLDEIGDEDVCQLIWDERAAPANIILKGASAEQG